MNRLYAILLLVLAVSCDVPSKRLCMTAWRNKETYYGYDENKVTRHVQEWLTSHSDVEIVGMNYVESPESGYRYSSYAWIVYRTEGVC